MIDTIVPVIANIEGIFEGFLVGFVYLCGGLYRHINSHIVFF